MRFHRILDEVFGQRSKVALLRLLVRVRGEHTGRDLARMAGLDHKTCHAALRDLAQHGLIEVRRLGPAHLYKLNDGHAVVRRIVEPAFRAEESLVEEYAADARRRLGLPLESLILFGSVARGEEEARSDVDLLFVAADERAARAVEAKVSDLMFELSRRYGNVPQILVTDAKALRDRVRHGDPFYSEVLRTGRVLHGKPLRELLKNGR